MQEIVKVHLVGITPWRTPWWSIYGTNWFFVCFCKLRKAENHFNSFRVGVIKNWHSHLSHRTLKSAKSQEWNDKFSWFFACWEWWNYFLNVSKCEIAGSGLLKDAKVTLFGLMKI